MPIQPEPAKRDIKKPVRRIMSRPAIWTSVDATVAEAASQMLIHGIGFLPVVEEGRIVGTVTDRDLAIDVLSRFKDLGPLPVRDVMRCLALTCTEDTTVEEAAYLMGGHQVRRLPILDADGVLVGVVSLTDIALEISEQLAGETLGEIAEDR